MSDSGMTWRAMLRAERVAVEMGAAVEPSPDAGVARDRRRERRKRARALVRGSVPDVGTLDRIICAAAERADLASAAPARWPRLAEARREALEAGAVVWHGAARVARPSIVERLARGVGVSMREARVRAAASLPLAGRPTGRAESRGEREARAAVNARIRAERVALARVLLASMLAGAAPIFDGERERIAAVRWTRDPGLAISPAPARGRVFSDGEAARRAAESRAGWEREVDRVRALHDAVRRGEAALPG